MATDKTTNDRRIREFTEACARLGIKVTHQRIEVFRAVTTTEEHPDAVSIHRRVRRRIPTISLDTVYRNLRLLAEHHLISIVGMSQENARFDGNMRPHHHFTCIKCGLIRDFYSGDDGHPETPEAALAFGTPLSVHMEIKGVCTACGKKIGRK